MYGTLFGLLNVSSHDVVAKLMNEVNELLKSTVAEGNWTRLKQLLRFYGELVNANVILPTSYCGLLSGLLSALDEPNQHRVGYIDAENGLGSDPSLSDSFGLYCLRRSGNSSMGKCNVDEVRMS